MSSIKNNFLYNIAYQLLLIILPLITAPYILRTIGAKGLGVYSYTSSVANCFVLFAMLGISTYGNRSIASVKDNKKNVSKLFIEIYFIQLATSFIACTIYIFYIFCLNPDNTPIVIIQMAIVIAGMLDISWLYFGLEQFKLTVLRNIIIKLVVVVSIFCFVRSSTELWKYVTIMGVGIMVSNMYLWLHINKYVSFKGFRMDWRRLLQHLKPIRVLFIPVIAYSVYKVMDKIMIGNMSTYTQLGFFESAEKIVNIPLGIVTAFGTVMLPRMSYMIAKGEKDKSEKYMRMSMKFVSIIASAIAFGLMGTSKTLVPVYFGEEFIESSALIMMLSCTVIFIAWASVIRTQYLIPNQLDNIYVMSTLIGAVVNLCFNFVLIPIFQAKGAVIGTVAAEFTVMIIQVIALMKRISVHKYILMSLPYILIGMIMGIMVNFIGSLLGISIFSLIVQVFCGGVIFIILLCIYWVLSKDEMFLLLKDDIRGKLYMNRVFRVKK